MEIFPDIPMFQNWRQSTLVSDSSLFRFAFESVAIKMKESLKEAIL